MSKDGKMERPKNWLEKMNEEYAFVIEGGDARIFTKSIDPDFGYRRVQTLKPAAFRAAFDNKLVDIAPPDAEKPKLVGLGSLWYRHAGRRQYLKGTTLQAHGDAPEGYYNLWTGWGVEPKPGNWSKMDWHIRHIVCGGDAAKYEYLMGWAARAVQHPDKQGETAVVMRGKKGVGKGMLGNALVDMFGGHGVQLVRTEQLTGKFNAHLQTAVMVFADEALFAGDNKNQGALKALITEGRIGIEKKGIDLTEGKNRTHIIMATNSDWAIQASSEERRYFVLDVLSDKREDYAYFDELKKEMATGGLAAMLHDLLEYDISDFNVRKIPQTAGLLEQKLRTLGGVQLWLYECLQNEQIPITQQGRLTWDENGVTFPKTTTYEAFVVNAARYKCSRDIPIIDQWSKVLREILITVGDRRSGGVRHLKCGPLDEAREQFENLIGHEIDWPERLKDEQSEGQDGIAAMFAKETADAAE